MLNIMTSSSYNFWSFTIFITLKRNNSFILKLFFFFFLVKIFSQQIINFTFTSTICFISSKYNIQYWSLITLLLKSHIQITFKLFQIEDILKHFIVNVWLQVFKEGFPLEARGGMANNFRFWLSSRQHLIKLFQQMTLSIAQVKVPRLIRMCSSVSH